MNYVSKTVAGLRKFRAGSVTLGLSLAVLASLSLTAPVAAQNEPGPRAGAVVPGRFIVTFQSGTGDASGLALGLARANGFGVRHVYQNVFSGMAIEIPAGTAALPILDALSRNPNVKSVGNDRYAAKVDDIEPLGIQRVFADPNNAIPNGGSGVRVAVVDTGLDFNHSDLNGNIDTNASRICTGGTDVAPLVLGNCVPGGQDDEGHGTFVGGIIAAEDNGSGLIGVAPAATLLSVKVLDSTGFGTLGDIIAALDYIQGLTGPDFVHLVNMSLAATCSVCTENSTDAAVFAFQQAVEALVAHGTTVVVAASNEGIDASTSVPAAFDAVITVSAIADTDGQPGGNGPALLFIGLGRQKDDAFAKFSNYGADIDVTAPGVNVTSLNLGGGTATGSGTSFSSPHAAGVAALFVFDWIGKYGSAPSPATVRDALIQTGECKDGNTGTVFYGDNNGCSSVWPGDRDGIAEPMVRADNVVNYTAPGPTVDVAVTGVSAPGATLVNNAATVSVTVANQGDQEETFDLSLDDGALNVGIVSVTLAAGASATEDFSWTPVSSGIHQLVAFADVAGDNDPADNTASTSAWVADEQHDVAVLSVSGPTSVNQGSSAAYDVEVQNQGTFSEDVTVRLVDTSDGDLELDSVSVAGLQAGTTTTATLTWTTDASTATGSHALEARADPVGTETDVADNSAAISVDVSQVSAATSMHVAALAASSINNGSTWTAVVDATIVDNNGAPVQGATINGTWSGGASGSDSCTTDGSGLCTVSMSGIRKRDGSATFTVTTVSGGGLTYASGDNVVSSVVVLKP